MRSPVAGSWWLASRVALPGQRAGANVARVLQGALPPEPFAPCERRNPRRAHLYVAVLPLIGNTQHVRPSRPGGARVHNERGDFQSKELKIVYKLGMLYHASLTIIKRSEGQSTLATLAYDMRTRLSDERTGQVHRYTRGSETEVPAHIFGIEDMDARGLWQAVEFAEKRKDSQLAYRLIVAGQTELSSSQNRELFHDIFHELAEWLGCAGTWVLHEKEGNPHAHGMLTMRKVAVESGKLNFSEKLKALNPFATKCRDGIERLRTIIADTINKHLAKAKSPARVDHRSYRRQGVNRIPQIHEGPIVSKCRALGLIIGPAQVNEEIRAMNERLAGSPAVQPAEIVEQNATQTNSTPTTASSEPNTPSSPEVKMPESSQIASSRSPARQGSANQQPQESESSARESAYCPDSPISENGRPKEEPAQSKTSRKRTLSEADNILLSGVERLREQAKANNRTR